VNNLFYAFVLAVVLLLAGCNSPDNKEVEGDNKEAAVTTVTNSVPSAGEEPEQPEQEDQQEQEDQPEQPVSKVSKVSKAVIEAKEANKASNTVVVDSIMDRSEKTEQPVTEKDTLTAKMNIEISLMKSLAKDLKQKAESNDTAQVKEIAGQIEQAWGSVKSDVQAKFPDMYNFLDDKLTELAEKTNSTQIDMKAVVQLDYQIYQGCRQLSEKLNG
jgi:hypothetical protein